MFIVQDQNVTKMNKSHEVSVDSRKHGIKKKTTKNFCEQ